MPFPESSADGACHKRLAGGRMLILRERSAGAHARPLAYVLVFLTGVLGSLTIQATAPSTASALPEKFFGMQFSPPYLDSEPDMEAVGRSGAKYWRLGMDCYDWYGHESTVWQEKWDNKVKLAWEHGLTVLPTISGRCKSASIELPSRDEWEPAGSPWEGFIKALVARYGYGGSFWSGKENKREIETWEIQNEPNLADGGREGLASGWLYAEFFRRASETLHAAQGTFFPTRALVGGLYYVHSNGASKTPHTFMQEMANQYPSVKGWVDGVAIHPYEWNSVVNVEADINEARSDVDTYFGASKSLWITEIGWNVENGEASRPNLTLAQQSAWLTELFNWVRGVQAAKNIQSLIYYNYRDFDFGSNPWWTRAGLRSRAPADHYSQSTFRPAWYAFQSQTGAASWPVAPGGETQAATGVSSTSAKLNGIINPHGLPTGYHFEWAEGSEGFSHWLPANDVEAGWKEGNIAVSQELAGLKPNTSYTFRIVGTNENNEISGGTNLAFKTHAGNPAAIVDSDGVTHVYFRGQNNQLQEYYKEGSAWRHKVWGYAGVMGGDPVAIQGPAKRRWVYFRGSNGELRSWWFEGVDWNEQSWGYENKIVGKPAVVETPAGRRWLYFRGPNNELRTWWFQGPDWNEQSWGYSGKIYSNPTALETSAGRRWVYFKGPNGEMRSWWFQGSDWNEQSWGYGNKMVGSPVVVETPAGRRWLYFRGPNNELRTWWFQGPDWNEQSWGYAGKIYSNPTALETSAGRRWVYFKGPNGEMRSWWFQGSDWHEEGWGGSSKVVGDPNAVVNATGKAEVFYAGADAFISLRRWLGDTDSSEEPLGY